MSINTSKNSSALIYISNSLTASKDPPNRSKFLQQFDETGGARQSLQVNHKTVIEGHELPRSTTHAPATDNRNLHKTDV